jgi:hypothetical protein
MLRSSNRRKKQIPGWRYAAVGLGVLAGRSAQAQSFVDFKTLYYQESEGRTQVLNPMLLVHQDLGANFGVLDLNLSHDTISGASPNGGYPTLSVTTTTSASGHSTSNASGKVPLTTYNDHRDSISLGYSRRLGAHMPSIEFSHSKEKDYIADSIGLSDSWTIMEGRGTLHGGFSFSNDTVAPVTTTLTFPKKERSFALGWTWILGEDDLMDVSGSLGRLAGDLNDPYKIVPVGLTTLPDRRPDTRERKTVVIKEAHHFDWDGALKTNYRYYWDDWGIKSHTLDFTYDQRVDDGWTITPRLRYYTQSAATFFSYSFDAQQPYLSADYRLSSFNSILVGLTTDFELTEGFSLNLGSTYQIQHGRDRITPIATAATPNHPATFSGPLTSAADLNTVTFTVGIKWKF